MTKVINWYGFGRTKAWPNYTSDICAANGYGTAQWFAWLHYDMIDVEKAIFWKVR